MKKPTKKWKHCVNPHCEWYGQRVVTDTCLKCKQKTFGKVGRLQVHILTTHTTIVPGVHCSPGFAFAQCVDCKAVYQVKAKGRLPHCDDVACIGMLQRIRRID